MTQDQALQILKTGANVFLTGEPGSGKTHTLRTYIKYLKSHNIEPSVTASTGIAATHIHGLTIHSWSGIGAKDNISKYDIEYITSREYIAKRIVKAKVLIIDEISMLSSSTLTSISIICKNIRGGHEPFGGLQVILVGDFFQLPPINKTNYRPDNFDYENNSNGDDFAFYSNIWKESKFVTCYLSEQHRQDDAVLLSVLGAIRENNVGEIHLEHLRKRYNKKLDDEFIKQTKLFTHNVKVDELNNLELNKLSNKKHIFNMTHKGKANHVENLIRGCLSPETLELKLNARVMCTKNNSQRGFVNGTLGIVIGYGEFNNYPIIKTQSGSEILIEPMSWQIEDEGKVKAEITQVPLRLAWAITVHKSQGMSLDNATIDLSKTFVCGQGYVALSRVRTLAGINLIAMNQKALSVHPDILKKDIEFKDASYDAEVVFAKIPKEDMVAMHRQFILSNGGTIDTVNKEKIKKLSTHDATLQLFKQGLKLEEMARERNIKITSILDHIYVLMERGDISNHEVLQLVDNNLSKDLNKIYTVFNELGHEKLSPVYEHLKGKFTYDDLRLARIVYKTTL